MKYEHILTPIRIGNVILKNRLCCPNSSNHYIQGSEPFPAESFRADIAGRARNGAAYIVVGEWDNPIQHTDAGQYPDGWHFPSFNLQDPSNHNYFAQMTRDVHFYGSKLFVFMDPVLPVGFSLSGGLGHDLGGNERLFAPLPENKMGRVIDKFTDRLMLYKELGYDGLSIRGDYFLTAKEGEREDKYGGSVPNRARFLKMLLTAVRECCGRDFLVEMVLHGEQPLGYAPGPCCGYTQEEALEFLKELEGLVHIVQLREKNLALAHPLSYNSVKGVHGTLEYAKKVRESGVNIVIAVNGGYQNPDEIESYLADGIIDMASAARAFYCDPQYIKKISEGAGDEITPCIRCNKCHGPADGMNWNIVCSVNPVLGMEYEMHRLVKPSERSKKVAVIGAGAAGLRAAMTAGQRGHKVTVFEKTDYLGGQLYHGDVFDFKWTIRDYRLWMIRMCEKFGVKFVTGKIVTPEELKTMGFDAVIAAIGSTPIIPETVEGTRDESGCYLYRTCHDIIGKEETVGKTVAIVGGSSTGVETGMYLAASGHHVKVFSRQDHLAHEVTHVHSFAMADLAEKDGKTVMLTAWDRYEKFSQQTCATVYEVRGNTLFWRDIKGISHEETFDEILFCGGVRGNMTEALSYSGCAPEFFVIGECAGHKDIQQCNFDAYSCASNL